MTDEERFNRVAAALMGKDLNCSYRPASCPCDSDSPICTWSAIHEGEISKEFRNWMRDNLSRIWREYCDDILYSAYVLIELPEAIDQILIPANLLQYLKDHVQEWAYQECPVTDCTPVLCGKHKECQYTGKVIIEKYREAVKILEGE